MSTTLSSYGVALARTLDDYGLDSAELFRGTGLEPEVMKNPNARYPDAALHTLLGQAVTLTGDDYFGLALARHIGPTTLHALGFSLLASETLEAALQRLVRYYRLVSDGVGMRLELDRQTLGFEIDCNSAPTVAVDALLAALVRLLRLLHGGELELLRVCLQRSAPAPVEPFRDWFRAPLEFDAGVNRLELSRSVSASPLPTGNAELAYQNDKIVADYLSRFDGSRLSERIRAIFMERLVTGKFSEEQIAEQLNLSLRSLQRRLREEQTSYQQLLDETRLELALQYINRTRLSVAQIAPLLGFSDSSNFNRAFKRWLGISPSRYRALEHG